MCKKLARAKTSTVRKWRLPEPQQSLAQRAKMAYIILELSNMRPTAVKRTSELSGNRLSSLQLVSFFKRPMYSGLDMS